MFPFYCILCKREAPGKAKETLENVIRGAATPVARPVFHEWEIVLGESLGTKLESSFYTFVITIKRICVCRKE